MSKTTDSIRKKFGAKGLKVYSLIDGKRNVEQIMKMAKVDEEYIIDFIGFLKNGGIIKLKHKANKTPKPKARQKPKTKRTSRKKASKRKAKAK